MNTIDIIRLIRRTLDTIRVSGKEDIDAMLGCMNALDTLVNTLEKEKEQDDGRQDNQ